jgi:hypothetical protein
MAALLYVLNPVDPVTNLNESVPAKKDEIRIGFNLFLLLAVATAGLWIAYAFTGDPYERRGEMVRFAYFFVVSSLTLLSIPPLVKSQAIGTEPIGIVSGCVKDTKADQLRCQSSNGDANSTQQQVNGYRNQWLVNIGGTLESQNKPSELCKDYVSNPRQSGPRIPPECKVGSPQNRAVISGGLVVPFPFVIIAMFGGAISLSRRVPEIQKRSETDYVSTPTDPALQPGEVRELLAFQILQFVSAPLIAITAHQVIQPETQATSVALAFMSGFGSEAILLMVRGVFNGISHKTLTPAAAMTGEVGGVVRDVQGPVANMEVGVAGTAHRTKTDTNGNYLIRDVPIGGREVVVRKGNQESRASVAVVAGQTAVCDLALS